MKILVVEDERDLNGVIVKYLKRYSYSVDSVYNGEEALDYIEAQEYDIILLDVMMPKLDGYNFAQKIRADKIDTPIIFLTAKDSVEDKIKGLNLGGDDYIVKPFSFDELIARINAVVRRKYGNAKDIIQIGNVKVDMSSKSVKVNDNMIDLTSKEYAVLEYLFQNKDKIVSREQIRQHAWDFDYEGESNIIDVIIKNIRKKVGKEENIIQTKRGIGYVVRES